MAYLTLLSGCLPPNPYATDDTNVPITTDESPTPYPDVEMPTPPPDAPFPDSLCSDGRVVVVDYTVDGDTVALENSEGERVRLVGIDTPELSGDDGYPECYALEAASATDVKVSGETVCLTYDPAVAVQSDNVDYYGRTLGYVFYGDQFEHFLNAELVTEGFAEDYPYTDGAIFERYFYDLEAYAKANQSGRWGACENSEKH